MEIIKCVFSIFKNITFNKIVVLSLIALMFGLIFIMYKVIKIIEKV